jgi:hypothetical protein
MKNEDNKRNEEKIKPVNTGEQADSGREHIDPLDKKETMEERAKRENWTDIAESHLGIDE